MKKSEFIQEHYSALIDAMVDAYEDVAGSYGRVQYKIYIWDDGQIERLQGCQGDSTRLVPRQCEPRELYYVCTVGGQYIDPWDFSDHSAPDDDDEREQEEQEILDWLVDDYKHNGAEAALDEAIKEAEQEEYWNS